MSSGKLSSGELNPGELNKDQLLVKRLFGFITVLRDSGFNISSDEIKSAHQIATLPLLQSESHTHDALRAVFSQSNNQWREFTPLFKSYWYSFTDSTVDTETDPGRTGGQRIDSAGLGYFSESQAQEKTLANNLDTLEVTSGGASDARVLSQRDFRFVFNPHDMRRIEYIVDELSRRMQRRIRRRTRLHRKRGIPDSRHTARASLQHGGWPFELRFRRKQKAPARFLLLLDVSQSMEIYSYLFLRFARGILQAFADTDAFAFHTDLIPIGNELKDKSTRRLERKLKDMSSGWLGGTRIAESLQHFNEQYANRALHKNTILIVFSDGYDSGDTDQLVEQVVQLKSQCRKLVWVNPLLGRKTPDDIPLPVDKSMLAVLPHLDLYTSAHSVASLRNLESAFSYG